MEKIKIETIWENQDYTLLKETEKYFDEFFKKDFQHVRYFVKQKSFHLPAIYIKKDRKENKFKIEISTVGHGIIKVEELEEVVKNHERAIFFVHSIENIVNKL